MYTINVHIENKHYTNFWVVFIECNTSNLKACLFFELQISLEHEILLHPRYFGPQLMDTVRQMLFTEVEGTCTGKYVKSWYSITEFFKIKEYSYFRYLSIDNYCSNMFLITDMVLWSLSQQLITLDPAWFSLAVALFCIL